MPELTDVADNELNPAGNGPISPDAQSPGSSSSEAVNARAPSAAPANVASEQSSDAEAADAESDDSEPSPPCRTVWDVIESYTTPALISPKWGFLGDPNGWLLIDMAPGEFVESLEQEVPVEELLHYGLYERVDDELRLPSCLDADADLYVAIDKVNSTLTFSHLHEFLFPMTRTALDYALERMPLESSQTSITLFVVSSLDAVDVMRRLGLRALSSEGLDEIGRDEVLRLFAGDLRCDIGWRYHLVLLDFDLADLENRRIAAIGAVINRLSDATDLYGIDPSRRFSVCRPSPHEFQLLERAVSFEDSMQICQIFNSWSATAQAARIDSWRTHFETAAPSFSVARAALTRALEPPIAITGIKVRPALAAYRTAGKAAVIEKFYSAIDQARDPFDQLDMIAALDYAEKFLDSDPLVRKAEVVLAVKNPFSSSARELQDEAFEQRRQCMVELRRIQRDRKGKR